MYVKSALGHALDQIEEIIFTELPDSQQRLDAIETLEQMLAKYPRTLRGRVFYEEQERHSIRRIADMFGRHYATVRGSIALYRESRGKPPVQRAHREAAERLRLRHAREAQGFMALRK